MVRPITDDDKQFLDRLIRRLEDIESACAADEKVSQFPVTRSERQRLCALADMPGTVLFRGVPLVVISAECFSAGDGGFLSGITE